MADTLIKGHIYIAINYYLNFFLLKILYISPREELKADKSFFCSITVPWSARYFLFDEQFFGKVQGAFSSARNVLGVPTISLFDWCSMREMWRPILQPGCDIPRINVDEDRGRVFGRQIVGRRCPYSRWIVNSVKFCDHSPWLSL